MKRDDKGQLDKSRRNRREITYELSEEKEKLLELTAKLQGEKLRLEEQVHKVREDLDYHQQEQVRLQRRLAEIEEENRRFYEEYSEMERHNTNLANLYVALSRLHEALDQREVLTIIQEILFNLVGAEELAVFELDTKRGVLSLMDSAGIDPTEFQHIPLGVGLIGRTASSGDAHLAGKNSKDERAPYEVNLTACVPLKVDGRVAGAIAVFRLVEQKEGLESLDYELLSLLATHAAKALCWKKVSGKSDASLER